MINRYTKFPPAEWASFSTKPTTTANFTIRTKSGSQFKVDWGDGTITSHANNATASKGYATAYSGVVKITSANGKLTDIDSILSSQGAWNFDISTIASQCSAMTNTVYFTGNAMVLTGNISTLPSGLTNTVFFNGNAMTLTGDIANLPSGLSFQVYFLGRLMTLTGDMKFSAINTTYYHINGALNNISYTSGRVWKNITLLFTRLLATHFTATEVDNIFIDLDNSPLVTGAGTIDLRGSSAPPTSASLTARNSLVTKGKTLLYN